MDDLTDELSQITVTKPTKTQESEVKADNNSPNSYKSNNSKEIQVLTYAENFRRQFVHLYRDRKPLFLAPPNEFAIEVLIFDMNIKGLITEDFCVNIREDKPLSSNKRGC